MEPLGYVALNPIYEAAEANPHKIQKISQTILVNEKNIEIELIYSKKGVSDRTAERDLKKAVKRVETIDFLFVGTEIKKYSFTSDKKLTIHNQDKVFDFDKRTLKLALTGQLKIALQAIKKTETPTEGQIKALHSLKKAIQLIDDRASFSKVINMVAQLFSHKEGSTSIEKEIKALQGTGQEINTRTLSRLFNNRYGLIPLMKCGKEFIPMPSRQQLKGAYDYAHLGLPHEMQGHDRANVARMIQEILCGPSIHLVPKPTHEVIFSYKELAVAKEEIPLKLSPKSNYLAWHYVSRATEKDPVAANLNLFFKDNVTRPSDFVIEESPPINKKPQTDETDETEEKQVIHYNLQTDTRAFFTALRDQYFNYLNANPSLILAAVKKNIELADSTKIPAHLTSAAFKDLLEKNCHHRLEEAKSIVELTTFTSEQLQKLATLNGIAVFDVEPLLRVMALRFMLVANQRTEQIENSELDAASRHPAEICTEALGASQLPVFAFDHTGRRAVIHPDCNGITFHSRFNVFVEEPDLTQPTDPMEATLHLPITEVAWSKSKGPFLSYEREYCINAIVPWQKKKEAAAVMTSYKNMKVGPNSRNILNSLVAGFKQKFIG